MKPLIIVGNSEIAKLAYEYFTHDSDYEIAGFCAQAEYCDGNEFLGLPLIAIENIEHHFPPASFDAFVAIGSSQLNYLRAWFFNIMKSKGYSFASYISSKSFIWHNVKIGENCFILEDNTLQPFVEIGNNVTLWSGNHIGHSSVIHDHVFVSSHVVISGFCKIKEHCFLGVNAALGEQVQLGKNNFIAMSASVHKSTQDNQLMLGVPAKPHQDSTLDYFNVSEQTYLYAD